MGVFDTDLPNSLQWSEGLLLSPQHLQQNDIYWHQRLHMTAQHLDPTAWGVRKLTLNEAQLQNGMVALVSLEACLSDGTVVQFPGSFGQVEPPLQLTLDIAPLISTGVPLRVWLVVPQRGRMAAAASNPQQRFLSYSDNGVPDESAESPQETIAINRLLPRLSLNTYPAPPAQYDYCQLFEVVRDADKHYSLTQYHPPMLCLGASQFLGANSLYERIGVLKKNIWDKLHELVRQNGSDTATDLSDQDAGQLTIARHLAMSLPLLSIMADSPESRPSSMYAMLAQVAGQVAPIGDNPMPPVLAAYNHEACHDQFDTVINYIARKVQSINTRYVTQAFARLPQYAGFGMRLPAQSGPELIVELRPRDGQNPAALWNWLHGSLICAAELIKELRDRRIAGAARRALEPKEIAARGLRRGGLFYLLTSERLQLGNQMQAVFKPGCSLLISNPEHVGQAPLDIILHTLRPAATSAHADPLNTQAASPAIEVGDAS